LRGAGRGHDSLKDRGRPASTDRYAPRHRQQQIRFHLRADREISRRKQTPASPCDLPPTVPRSARRAVQSWTVVLVRAPGVEERLRFRLARAGPCERVDAHAVAEQLDDPYVLRTSCVRSTPRAEVSGERRRQRRFESRALARRQRVPLPQMGGGSRPGRSPPLAVRQRHLEVDVPQERSTCVLPIAREELQIRSDRAGCARDGGVSRVEVRPVLVRRGRSRPSPIGRPTLVAMTRSIERQNFAVGRSTCPRGQRETTR